MSGECAKKVVTCEIVTLAGDIYKGTNSCNNPQIVCPRTSDDGYEKCRTVCHQIHHAEIAALNCALAKFADVRGATAVIHGIGWSCRNCQEELYSAGIKFITIGEEY